MVRNEPLIGVSECYCRLAKDNRGDEEPCTYPRETCFTFNELAQTLIETGLAREIDADEAVHILRNAEDHGLIHNVDNCQGHLKALCNCCPCCCPAIKSYKAGVRNVNSASRYLAVWNEELCTNCGTCVDICPVEAISPGRNFPEFLAEKCIGCGLCVTNCPETAIRMELRAELPRIPKDNDALWSRIRNEAIVTMVKDKVFGSKNK
ncbi:MAG: 4Fe-4S binding protein [Anaerolineales bacterium]|nr:4Fe-4S binding protein [Anaerolineales bacterium]